MRGKIIRILIVEGDKGSTDFISAIFSTFGNCDVVTDINDAADAYERSWADFKPYNMVCINNITSGEDNVSIVNSIRAIEQDNDIEASERVNIIITNSIENPGSICGSVHDKGFSAYQCKTFNNYGETENAGIFALPAQVN